MEAKAVTNAAAVVLSDPQGRPRLRMTVDSLGAPKLELLDENGKITQQLPQLNAYRSAAKV